MRGRAAVGSARSRALPRALVLVALLLVWWGLGPYALAAASLTLLVPAVRRWAGVTWRFAAAVVGAWVGVVALLVAAVVLLPAGRLPIPPGGGSLVSPGYVGEPATEHPIRLDVPQHPHLAPNGASSMHDDGWATDTYSWAGPLGRDPEVDSAWYGIEECATLAFDTAGDLVALCGDRRGPVMRILDPETMRSRTSMRLPDRPDAEGVKPWENLCGGAYFFLDDEDRAWVATTDQRILVVRTDGAALEQEREHDVSGGLAEDDCLLALMPDWDGRVWFASLGGVVGFVQPTDGRTTFLDLGDDIANSFSVDDTGVYVVTNSALVKVAAPDGRPVVQWRAPYDAGSRRKPGQLAQGSGTTPTVLPGGLVAITDNAEPRMNVVFYRTADGREVCRAPVFEEGRSATDNSLVAVDGGVVVENNHGYRGPQSTMLGHATEPGIARVDVRNGRCSVAWTSDVIAPTSVPKVSLATGLLYVYSLRPSWWGVSAWYLTAVDVRTGRTAFSVRTGLGTLWNNHYAAVTLAPDGSAYVATLAGLVRVRDGG